jgi:hypothetical protein
MEWKPPPPAIIIFKNLTDVVVEVLGFDIAGKIDFSSMLNYKGIVFGADEDEFFSIFGRNRASGQLEGLVYLYIVEMGTKSRNPKGLAYIAGRFGVVFCRLLPTNTTLPACVGDF